MLKKMNLLKSFIYLLKFTYYVLYYSTRYIFLLVLILFVSASSYFLYHSNIINDAFDHSLLRYPYLFAGIILVLFILNLPIRYFIHLFIRGVQKLADYLCDIYNAKNPTPIQHFAYIPVFPYAYLLHNYPLPKDSNSKRDILKKLFPFYAFCSFIPMLIFLLKMMTISDNLNSLSSNAKTLKVSFSFFLYSIPILIVTLIIRACFSRPRTSPLPPVSKSAPLSFDHMNGQEFEEFCCHLLLQNGFYNVKLTPASNDHGIDILATKGKIRYAIQCKRYSNSVGTHAIQEAHSGTEFYKYDQAVVLTNNHFTSSATEHALQTGVILWDRKVLLTLIRDSDSSIMDEDTEAYGIDEIEDYEEQEYEIENSRENIIQFPKNM